MHKLERSHGNEPPCAADLHVLRQDLEAVIAADWLDSRRAQTLIKKESWQLAWQSACKGKTSGWAKGAKPFGGRTTTCWRRCASTSPIGLESMPAGIEAHRPIEPSEPMFGLTSRPLLLETPASLAQVVVCRRPQQGGIRRRTAESRKGLHIGSMCGT